MLSWRSGCNTYSSHARMRHASPPLKHMMLWYFVQSAHPLTPAFHLPQCELPGSSLSVPSVTESKLGDTSTITPSDIDGMHGTMAAGMCEAAFMGRGAVSRAALEMGLAVYRVDLDRLAQLRPTVILTQASAVRPLRPTARPPPPSGWLL